MTSKVENPVARQRLHGARALVMTAEKAVALALAVPVTRDMELPPAVKGTLRQVQADLLKLDNMMVDYLAAD